MTEVCATREREAIMLYVHIMYNYFAYLMMMGDKLILVQRR